MGGKISWVRVRWGRVVRLSSHPGATRALNAHKKGVGGIRAHGGAGQTISPPLPASGQGLDASSSAAHGLLLYRTLQQVLGA